MAKRTKGTRWSYSTGTCGTSRVCVYEVTGKPGIYIEWTEDDLSRPGKRCRKRRSLGLIDRKAAVLEAKSRELKLARGEPVESRCNTTSPRTLGELIDNYSTEVTPTKGETAQSHDKRTLPLFVRAFGGADRNPATLSRLDWDKYIKARRSGTLRSPKANAGQVGWRVVEQDLGLLRAVLNWGTQAGDGHGGFLLDRNPLRGLTIPKEESPRRALLTVEQYAAVRKAAEAMDPRIECFVVLAWHTGHRAASLRQLRWSDVDLDRGRVHFRGELDKIGLDHWNPLHAEAVSILKRERARVPAIGDAWIFPAPRDATQSRSCDAMANMWKLLAKAAQLPSGERYGWHSFRRAFANRLRRAPLRDLQDLGGWKTSATLMTVYLRADEGAQREVLELYNAPQQRTANG